MDDAETIIRKLMAKSEWPEGSDYDKAVNKLKSNIQHLGMVQDLTEALKFVNDSHEALLKYKGLSIVGRLIHRKKIEKAKRQYGVALVNASNLVEQFEVLRLEDGFIDEREV